MFSWDHEGDLMMIMMMTMMKLTMIMMPGGGGAGHYKSTVLETLGEAAGDHYYFFFFLFLIHNHDSHHISFPKNLGIDGDEEAREQYCHQHGVPSSNLFLPTPRYLRIGETDIETFSMRVCTAM